VVYFASLGSERLKVDTQLGYWNVPFDVSLGLGSDLNELLQRHSRGAHLKQRLRSRFRARAKWPKKTYSEQSSAPSYLCAVAEHNLHLLLVGCVRVAFVHS
jgi:hypothetical protein